MPLIELISPSVILVLESHYNGVDCGIIVYKILSDIEAFSKTTRADKTTRDLVIGSFGATMEIPMFRFVKQTKQCCQEISK